MPLRIAVNGFGRIGRSLFRVLHGESDLEVVAVNDLAPPGILAHLVQHDSVRGRFGPMTTGNQEALVVDDRPIPVPGIAEPERLPWKRLGVDVVVEATGRFTTRSGAARHLEAGASRVLVSCPMDDADLTVVVGINDDAFDPNRHRVVSNASCTTNCIAPALRVLHDRFGVERGVLTTVHAYTNDQQLLDTPHPDLRRARTAGLSIIPTTTGAARAVGRVLPELAERLDGVSVRVPTPAVSLADLSLVPARSVTAADINQCLAEASRGPLAGIMGYTDAPLVSVDYLGCTLSGVVDGLQTRVVDHTLAKIQLWYDNEWGYVHRLRDLLRRMGRG